MLLNIWHKKTNWLQNTDKKKYHIKIILIYFSKQKLLVDLLMSIRDLILPGWYLNKLQYSYSISAFNFNIYIAYKNHHFFITYLVLGHTGYKLLLICIKMYNPIFLARGRGETGTSCIVFPSKPQNNNPNAKFTFTSFWSDQLGDSEVWVTIPALLDLLPEWHHPNSEWHLPDREACFTHSVMWLPNTRAVVKYYLTP